MTMLVVPLTAHRSHVLGCRTRCRYLLYISRLEFMKANCKNVKLPINTNVYEIRNLRLSKNKLYQKNVRCMCMTRVV